MPTPPVFANALGIKSLYHYEKFRADRLSATLRDQRIYCSDPSNLNDPWDCFPTLDPEPLKDPATFRHAMDWLHSHASAPLRGDLKLELENRIRTDEVYAQQFLKGLCDAIEKMIVARRIYCLTPDPCCILMWSHYAENHSGICLEFATDKNPFISAMKVRYQTTYPQWISTISSETGMDMALTKSQCWEYEQEFRVFSTGSALPSVYHTVQGNRLPLAEGALTAVIAGCKANYEEIAATVKAHAPALPVKRAVKVDHRFELQIVN